MKVELPKGRYVLAVSGGVDSMVLLHHLANSQKLIANSKNKSSSHQLPANGYELIVAHFNHGIRPDSSKDEQLVKKTAKKYNLPFETGYGKLGPNASEEQARKTRYKFLNKVKKKYQ